MTLTGMVVLVQDAKSKNNSSTMSSDPPPSDALIQLISPDGYYTYLGIPKPSAAEIQAATQNVTSSFMKKAEAAEGNASKDANAPGASVIDEDLVKKNYRKLSLKHHPDKPGGDADTFRVLNRAQKVLMNPKLRHQYDILGLDLDDDEDDQVLHPGGGTGDDNKDGDEETTAQGIVHEIASMVMASIMHLGFRTGMFSFGGRRVKSNVKTHFKNYKIRVFLLHPQLFLWKLLYSILFGSNSLSHHF